MAEEKVKIRVLGISGSPRKGGNSEYLLKEALEGAKEVDLGVVETEAYSIAGKQFLPCIACLACAELGYCVRGKLDDFDELRDKWLRADAVIISAPVYHMGIPGQLKCFFDRLGSSLCCMYLFKLKVPLPKHLKVYGAIAQGMHLFSGQEHTMTQTLNHALWMGNVVISADFWESYIGVGGWTENKIEKDSLRKLCEAHSFDAETSIKACRSLGRRVAELALILKAGASQFTDYLKRDPVYGPFVQRIKGDK